MKLLMLNWKDHSNPTAGGAELLTEGILAELVKKGWEVTLFTSSFSGADRREEKNGYTIIRRGRYYTVQAWAVWYWFREFRKQKFDVVVDQIHGIPFFTPLYIFGSKNGHRVKKIAFIHEVAREIWYRMFPFPLNSIGFAVEKFYFLFYRSVPFMTVSEATKNDLLKEGVRPNYIHIIPEAIVFPEITAALAEKKKSVKDNVVIYIGRLAPMKRVEDLITAVGIATKQIPDLRLELVGRGERNYAERLHNLAESINARITFRGRVTEQEKNELLAAAKILSSTSVKEGFGLVILEAGYFGVPAVVYNIKGFSEAVQDGVTGVLTEPNPEALAEQLIILLKDPAAYKKLSENVTEYAEKFSFENAAEAFERIILS